jgi:hypothetical protein
MFQPLWASVITLGVAMGNMLPLGLIMFVIVGAMCVIPARIGAFAARKLSS